MLKSSTTTKAARLMNFKNGMRPVHPGEVLREDFLRPAGLTANALAKALHVPAPRINDIVRERRGVTADTAMRLARYFGGDAQSWLNLQTVYDLRIAEKANAHKIQREITPLASAPPDQVSTLVVPSILVNLAPCGTSSVTSMNDPLPVQFCGNRGRQPFPSHGFVA